MIFMDKKIANHDTKHGSAIYAGGGVLERNGNSISII